MLPAAAATRQPPPQHGHQGEGSGWLPSVGALATDEVERVCCKNGLLFHELLSAFSAVDSAVPFRSGSHTLQLQDFRVQFVKASEMAPRPAALAEARLHEAVSLREHTVEAQSAWLSHEEQDGGAVVQVREREDISEALAAYDGRMPWYGRFRSTLRQALQYAEPEMLGCPAAMLLVVASSDPNPIDRFKELSVPYHWPPVFRTGQFGAQDMPKVYVLVHDEAEGRARGGISHAAEVLRQMKSEFPTAPSKLLRINSLAPEAANLQQADIWRLPLAEQQQESFHAWLHDPNDPRLRHPVVGGPGVRGSCLSNDDLLNLREFALELAEKIVVPAMERRIFTLQANVTQSRKGVKNFVKSFWRKPREATSIPGGEDGSSTGHAPTGPTATTPRGSTVAALPPALYKHDRIEAQIRLLADTCFVMQDYEAALSNYKLIRDDFKSDKAWLHLGAVYEMIALCYHHLSSRNGDPLASSQVGAPPSAYDGRYRRDMEAAIEEAVKAYFRRAEEDTSLSASTASSARISHGAGGGGGGSSTTNMGARMATRASLLGAEFFLSASPPKAVDAAALLINAARRETPLCAAVLVEQAAWAYLQGGNIRKFAFYMSMAGQTYTSCPPPHQQERHAVRCYASALGLYEGTGWRHVLDHVHGTLGKQLLQLGHPERALYHLLRLVMTTTGGESEKSPQVQEALVQTLLQTCRECPQALATVVPFLEGGARAFVAALRRLGSPSDSAHARPPATSSMVVPNLALPLVLEETLSVTQGTEEPHGAEVEAMKGELLRELKTAAVMGEKGGSMREWVRALAKVAKEEVRATALLAAGTKHGAIRWRGRDEPVTVSVEIQNPLHIQVATSEMQVMASFDDDAASSSSSPSSSAAASLDLEVQDVHLAPQERKRLVLRVRPRRCGVLRVTGLRWRLFGELWGSIAFQNRGPLLQDTLERRASRERGANLRLVSRIVPELPLLEAELEGLPSTLFQGEMIQASLKITNRGLAPAAHVYAKSSLPSWLFMRDPSATSPPADTGTGGTMGVCMSMVGVSGTVFRVVTGGLAAGGATVRVPVWVRGLGGGKQTLRILVRYERQGTAGTTAAGASSQDYRYTEVVRDVCVLPSVSVVPSVSPSYSQPGECVLSLTVSNYRTDGEAQHRQVELHSVVALSRLWQLEFVGGPLSHSAEGGPATMAWQERTTLHYRLIPLEKEGDPLLYEHDLHTGALRSSFSSSLLPASAMILDDGFLSPSPAVSKSLSFSWASLDFLYVENASQSYRTAREEANRREAASSAADAGSAPRERAPLSLGDIKRKEAEKKAREAADSAATTPTSAAAGGGPSSLFSSASPAHRPKSPKLGMGMEGGTSHGGHLAALVPRGRATLNLLLTWRLVSGPDGQSPQQWRRGQHQILNHAVRPLTLDPTTAAPLTITVDAPAVLTGRLGPGGLLQKCQAEIFVTVHNRMTDMPVDFVFEALSAPSGKRQSANKAAASPSFVWLGSTIRCVKGLLPGASVRLPVRAAFLRPGVFDLNRFRFVALMAANSTQLVPSVAGSRLKLLHGGMVRVPYIFSAQYVIKVLATPGGPLPAGTPATPATAAAAAAASTRARLLPAAPSEVGDTLVQRLSSALSLGPGASSKEEENLVVLVEQAATTEEGPDSHNLLLSPPPLPGVEDELQDVDTVGTPLERSLAGSRDEEGKTSFASPPPSGSPRGSVTSPRLPPQQEAETEAAEVEVGEDQAFDAEGQEEARQLLELADGNGSGGEDDGEGGEPGE